MALMTNRILATVVVSIALAASAAPRAQTPAPSPPQSPPQAPPASPPSSQQPAPAPPQTGDLDQVGRDRVAPPKPTRQVNAGYTPEAIRNRIQGKVRLRGIVERDGTVSGIEVVESLDKQFG